jgi:hypothetical protein
VRRTAIAFLATIPIATITTHAIGISHHPSETVMVNGHRIGGHDTEAA